MQSESLLPLFQTLSYLKCDPGFRLGMCLYCFDYYHGIYAEITVGYYDSDPVVSDKDCMLG